MENTTEQTERLVRIVGIGASAGGLEAFEQFFSNTPTDKGIAYVIVQHLDPTGHSSMPQILARFTSMPIMVAEDGMKVKPNSVFLLPPNKSMGIRNGSLYLMEPASPPGLRLPIDFFFRSLAEEMKSEAICVILSGTGTDGTLGLRAIKAELGVVFVQDPASAKFDGMPRSAIETGLADFVSTPGDMPEKLIQFIELSLINGEKFNSASDESIEPMKEIFLILRKRTSHDFLHYKQTTIRRRLQRRMSVNQIDDIAQYAQFLKEDENEVKALLKDILISVTSFFRDPAAFEELKKLLIQMIKSKSASDDIRVWVAGCATGEEVYSVAMVIHECLEELDKHMKIQLYGTDIDIDALHNARTGKFPANIATDLTPARLKRYFVKEGNAYRVKNEIRENIVFASHNLIKDPPFSKMDLICCRNLLIYLESDLQKRIFPILHYALKPEGILFLGSSETVGEPSDLFNIINKKWKIYQRRETIMPAGRLRFPAAFTADDVGITTQSAHPVTSPSIQDLTEKIFLDNFAPTYAVIDDQYRLVYVRGRTGQYLEIVSGQPSLSILDMAREGLRTDLTTTVHRALLEKQKISQGGLKVKTNGDYHLVDLTVMPLTEPGLPSGLLMVIFQDMGPVSMDADRKKSHKGLKSVVDFENELKITKENLQTTIEELEATNEELKSANEELQSNNEEMQSTNEELDTSREELQSMNEELTTLNTELQDKNEQLSKANDDLNNFLNRTDIAIVFLDEDLRIRCYTPATSDIFNVRGIDNGRPINEITSRIEYENFADDAQEVLRTLRPKEAEVKRKDGVWYKMRILPYLTAQNAVSGLVISFSDIDEQKKLGTALMESEVRFRVISETSPVGMGVSSLEGTLLYTNPSFEAILGYNQNELIDKRVSDLFLKPDDRLSRLKRMKNSGAVNYYETRLRKKDGSTIWVGISTSPLTFDGRQAILENIQDITSIKQAEENLKKYSHELELTNKDLESFSFSIQHDLRAPLRALDGFSEMVIQDYEDKLDETGKDYLQRIRNASQSMSRLIDDMARLYRTTRIKVKLGEINLSEITESILAELKAGQPERQADFIIEPGLVVNADLTLVTIFLQNILENAWKFTKKRPITQIELGVSNQKGKKAYFIKDNGTGFDMKYADMLFKPFKRLHDDEEYEGSGIGLAIAEKVIARHNGMIWAEAAINKGTTIYFTLPQK